MNISAIFFFKNFENFETKFNLLQMMGLFLGNSIHQFCLYDKISPCINFILSSYGHGTGTPPFNLYSAHYISWTINSGNLLFLSYCRSLKISKHKIYLIFFSTHFFFKSLYIYFSVKNYHKNNQRYKFEIQPILSNHHEV